MEVLLDLFPCNISSPHGDHVKTRLIVADGRAYVFDRAANDDGDVVSTIVAADDVVSFESATNWPYRFTTSSGGWVVNRAQGCGCGHPLKRAAQAELLALVPA